MLNICTTEYQFGFYGQIHHKARNDTVTHSQDGFFCVYVIFQGCFQFDTFDSHIQENESSDSSCQCIGDKIIGLFQMFTCIDDREYVYPKDQFYSNVSCGNNIF